MRLGLFFVFSLMLLGLGCGGSSNYMLPVDNAVYPFRAPPAEDFESDAAGPAVDQPPPPTYDEDLLNEEVGDDDDDADAAPAPAETPAKDQGGAAKPNK